MPLCVHSKTDLDCYGCQGRILRQYIRTLEDKLLALGHTLRLDLAWNDEDQYYRAKAKEIIGN